MTGLVCSSGVFLVRPATEFVCLGLLLTVPRLRKIADRWERTDVAELVTVVLLAADKDADVLDLAAGCFERDWNEAAVVTAVSAEWAVDGLLTAAVGALME